MKWNSILLTFCIILLFQVSESRKKCVKRLFAEEVPATYENGPLIVTKDFIFLARGGFICETSSDLWRFNVTTLMIKDHIQYPEDCVSVSSFAMDTKGECIYLAGRHGEILKVKVSNFRVEKSLLIPNSQFSSIVVDPKGKFGYLVNELNPHFLKIIKIDLITFTFVKDLNIGEQNIGLIKPIFHPNKEDELLFFANEGILRINTTTFRKIDTVDIKHSMAFTLGPHGRSVLSIGLGYLSLFNLETYKAVKTPLNELTKGIGNPWIIHWFKNTNLLLAIYDIPGYTTFSYKFQVIDMENYTIIDDGILDDSQHMIQRGDVGLHDVIDYRYFLRINEQSGILSLDLTTCPKTIMLEPEKEEEPSKGGLEPTPTSSSTTPNQNPSTTDTNVHPGEISKVFSDTTLTIIIVSAVVGTIALVGIVAGVLFLVRRMQGWGKVTFIKE